MRDGTIVQSGKYNELLEAGLDFGALVAAHENSMELVEKSGHISEDTPSDAPKSPGSKNKAIERVKSEKSSLEKSKSQKGSSKLVEDEERETGRVNLAVYKQYCTEAFGWWGVAVVILVSLLWALSTLSGDYWLAYETSSEHPFTPHLLISVYAVLAVISCLLIGARAVYIAFLGLKTAQSFFNRILNSILHAPMSFFDTTPSGRILSRVSQSIGHSQKFCHPNLLLIFCF